MFPKFSKQAFNRLSQSVKEVQDFERSLGLEDDPRYDYEPVDYEMEIL